MGDQITEQRSEFGENAPTPVTRIHFLIHPGFLANSGFFADDREKYEKLLDLYVKNAKTLRSDEIMVVFTHSTPKELKEDVKQKKPYAILLYKK